MSSREKEITFNDFRGFSFLLFFFSMGMGKSTSRRRYLYTAKYALVIGSSFLGLRQLDGIQYGRTTTICPHCSRYKRSELADGKKDRDTRKRKRSLICDNNREMSGQEPVAPEVLAIGKTFPHRLGKANTDDGFMSTRRKK
ncbi:hypothetical protein CEXT_38041 [Caerostris extrusa]|uniref:Uncharacterized protein n=1 Tax=Caerostris extrusa TaxID=172846 RepID=A0AAV4TD96_CAEEX|nr:hypothetical protein CEXT_38041 [Caerostris extrusa]